MCSVSCFLENLDYMLCNVRLGLDCNPVSVCFGRCMHVDLIIGYYRPICLLYNMLYINHIRYMYYAFNDVLQSPTYMHLCYYIYRHTIIIMTVGNYIIYNMLQTLLKTMFYVVLLISLIISIC